MEIIAILFMVLMLFGAKALPQIASGLGRGIRQVKDAAEEIKQDIRDSANEVHKEIEESRKTLTEENPKSSEDA